MAARPPKASGARLRELAELRRAQASSGCVRGAGAVPRDVTGTPAAVTAASAVGRDVLPVPSALAPMLPDRGLVKGSVVSYRGAGTLLTGLLAAVTEQGGHAAAVGLPRLGLLAAAEMGARLDRLAVIPDAGRDPMEVAAILLDGMDLVVLGLGLGTTEITPSRARVLAAKARGKGATLLVTGGAWPTPDLSLESRVAGYTGLGAGNGRIRSISLDIEARGRAGIPHRGRVTARPLGGRVEWAALDETAAPRAEQPDAESREDSVAS